MHACIHTIILYTRITDDNCVGVSGFTIYDTRLAIGNDSTLATYQGRVEILTYHGWLPVCLTSNWDSSESSVLCHQLGYNYSTYSASEKLSVIVLYY